jgi:hypothetical protein
MKYHFHHGNPFIDNPRVNDDPRSSTCSRLHNIPCQKCRQQRPTEPDQDKEIEQAFKHVKQA